MLMLAVIRNLIKAHNSMAQHKWNRHSFTGTELWGKTIGIIGLGNVGHRVARFCNAFDCKVIAYDPYVTEEYCSGHNAEKVNLATLIQTSDIITIHTPKNKETTNMIGDAEIAQMKEGVILINAARGGLYNEAALERGMKSGKIRGLGIDTWEVEPVKEHPLKDYENVVMTPHIGASTIEAQYRIADTVASETLKALRGDMVATPVNLPDIGKLSSDLASHYAYLAGKLGSFSRQYIHRGFTPKQIEFQFRGNLLTDDHALIKLSYLKAFLQGTQDETVSFVNALHIAESKGILMKDSEDHAFSDYESAIRIKVKGQAAGGDQEIAVGGTVMGTKKVRLSYLNGYAFEIEPKGNILSIENNDKPGVIGAVGTLLGRHGVNINRFELCRTGKGERAMALVMVDEEVSTEVLTELRQTSNILRVESISLGG